MSRPSGLWACRRWKDENSDGSWFAGLAAIKPTTFIKGDDWPGTVVPNILIANVPQLIFSILYFIANSVWTSMALVAEWNSYSVHRKGLRVSTFLRGHQRSTYFLSLPYRYALPLISCSGLLHWLISQSLYVVIIRARGVNHERSCFGFSYMCLLTRWDHQQCAGGCLYAGLSYWHWLSTVQIGNASCRKL